MNGSFCPQCGIGRLDGFRFCGGCGLDFAALPAVPAAGPPPRPSRSAAALRAYARRPSSVDYLVLDHERGYVQFAESMPGVVRAEAASNVFLQPPFMIDAAQEAAILALGWQADPQQIHAGGNYWMELPVLLDPEELVDLARQTLAVYGADLDGATPTTG